MLRTLLITPAVIIATVPGLAVKPDNRVAVYIVPTTHDNGQFSDMLAARFWEFPKRIRMVDRRSAAKYILSMKVYEHRTTRNEGEGVSARPTIVASVFAHDQCGQLVWAKVKGDLEKNIFSGDDYGTPRWRNRNNQ